MSNKPRIYAYCPAGCKWETVHKDDFLKSASLIPVDVDDTNGYYDIELDKSYRVAVTSPADDALILTFYGRNENGGLSVVAKQTVKFADQPKVDQYTKHYNVRVLDFVVEETGYEATADVYALCAVIEVNGERAYVYMIGKNVEKGSKAPTPDEFFEACKIQSNSTTWLYNEDATTTAQDGYTPQKGVDYWTEDDKAEIKAYVEEAILGGEW